MNTPPRFCLRIPRHLVEELLQHARDESPNECCGLLAGRIGADGAIGEVTHRYPLINELASPTEFLSEPRSMFAAVKDMRANETEVVAVYHSHLACAPVPSRRDLELNYSPHVVNLIVGLAGDVTAIRGWWLTETDYHPAEWEVIEAA